ncbi:hypothetical protein AWM75_07180 [Aerococcus urinaehominis]|uniref:Uncharacterized protein n=1 Tax=Aerococcus urinaehominis TaxID=128944 RepID=A0A0X8FN75_9LACT|nr:hypothetical protein [Aerococcus urinaehominis]AMB99757.1 hypothetical protein AWM75_07180 [Aerococcus urinaehominis]SDM10123.1 Putative amino acid metabolism [Aerococcus urinaehominis]
MALAKTASLKGSGRSFAVAPNCKAYTLRDNSFSASKAGNYQYERLVQADFKSAQAVILKITVGKDVDKLQLATTNKAGLKAVNVYQNDLMVDLAKQVDYIFDFLVENGVLVQVD